MIQSLKEMVQVADDIRAVYRADSDNAVYMIEVFLAECWKEKTPEQKVGNLENLLAVFQKDRNRTQHQTARPATLEELVQGVRERYQEGGDQVVSAIERYLLDAFFSENASGKLVRLQQVITYLEESLRPRPPSVEKTAAELRHMVREPLEDLKARLEVFLNDVFVGLDEPGKIKALEDLVEHIGKGSPVQHAASGSGESEMFARLVRLLLDQRVEEVDLHAPETADKLADALNTVFDMMSDLMRTVQLTLLGESQNIRTLRTIIGAGLDSKQQEHSLKESLDMVKQSFLLCHQSFRQAASAKMVSVLEELSAENLATNGSSWLKVGGWHKAQLFDEYKERFDKVKVWYESGRFDKELLAEFEKYCRERFK